ncbi:hypothetical protein P691DRAFT_800783 [Macrolepiota fuliginosa MF-IS2]|uniref:F-box domain-containing protein n=1 Tax=Macrolepiota fuliginosa MF-IS2 TaxID=1400762 RepID=A0A9P5XES3_9AGAR|nr:hypothetical protein P691DRAFT_800783 [Macrolepiota fuliginosa MF-IS2]
MTQGTRATIHDLPIEVLDIILDGLDNRSLLALARVSRSLGQAMLWSVVPATTIHHVNSHSEFIIGPDAPAAFLPVVAVSLWTPKITAITYSVERDDEGHFLDDMRGLSAILPRLTRGLLKSLNVRIAFDYAGPARRFEQWRDTDKSDWPEVLSRLLDIATSVGCSRIEFSNGQIRPLDLEPYPFEFPDRPDAFSRFRDDIKSMFREFNHKPLSPTTPGVRALIFETPIFFTDHFLSRTVKVLQQTSPTIQSLTISFPGSRQWIRSGWLMWSNLCLSVRFPHLSSLVLKSSEATSTVDITCDALLDLLSHLPNLTSLTFDFVLRFPLIPLRKRYPILPKLESLEAQSRFLPWLIPFTRRAWKRGPFLPIAGGMKWRPSPMSIRILPARREMTTMDDPDVGILCLNALFPLDRGSWSPPAPDISVTLEMNFAERPWVQWIIPRALKHRSTASSRIQGRPGPLEKSRIVRLMLAVVDGSAGPQSPLPDDNFSQIIEWMGMFPKLEHLEILGQPFIQSAVNGALCAAILKGCPQLKSFKFNGNTIESGYSRVTSPMIHSDP